MRTTTATIAGKATEKTTQNNATSAPKKTPFLLSAYQKMTQTRTAVAKAAEALQAVYTTFNNLNTKRDSDNAPMLSTHKGSVGLSVLNLLGGWEFAVMAGAYDFRSFEHGLHFKLPIDKKFPVRDKIHVIEIMRVSTCRGDTYDFRGFKGDDNGENLTPVTLTTRIPENLLLGHFTIATGIDTNTSKLPE